MKDFFNIIVVILLITTLCITSFNIKLTSISFHSAQDEKIANEKYELVIQSYNEYLKINPYDSMAYFMRGKAYYYSNYYKSALNDFIKYKKIEKDLVSVYRYIGNCYSHIGKAEKAIETFTKGLEKYPKSAMLLNNRSYAKCISGYDLQDALKDVNEALAIETSAHAYHTRAKIQRNLGFYQYAISDAEKSLEEAPCMYYNHCEKGYSHMKLGQRAEGIHHLKLCKQASEENDDFKNKALYEEYLK